MESNVNRLKIGIEKAMQKYKYLQEETVFIENEENYLCINWHVYRDKYINYKMVCYIAKFLRRYTDKPIYSSFGIIHI